MREQLLSWRLVVAVLVVAGGVVVVGVVGLAWFRRDYARRVALVAVAPNVELAWGAFWFVLAKTFLFVLRYPRTLLLGLVHAAHLLVGVDPLEALDDATLHELQREAEAEREADP